MMEDPARSLLGSASSLTEEDGIYFARSDAAISYPDEGNDLSRELEGDSFWFTHRNRCIVSLARRFSPEPRLIVDVGGGNGYVSKGLQDAGFSTIVVEPMRAGALNARARGLRFVVCATLEDAGFPPESIPAVGLFDVLEHIEDDFAFLGSLRDRLSPDGRVYLTVPSYQFLWSEYDTIAGHYRRYTAGQLRKTFEAAGFEIDYLSYLFWFLPPPVFLGRTVPSLLGSFRNGIPHERAKREHSKGGGLAGRVVQAVCDWEASHIGKGRLVPFGGSCIAVARKRK